MLKHNGNLYFSHNDSTVKVISVNDPANPQEINSVEFEDDIKLYTTWQDSNGTEYPIAIVDNRYLKVFAFLRR